MGKRIIAQRRGTGHIKFRAPSYNYVAEAKYKPIKDKIVNGKVIDLLHCPGHDAPLAKIKYEDSIVCYNLACEGLAVGDIVMCGNHIDIKNWNVLPL